MDVPFLKLSQDECLLRPELSAKLILSILSDLPLTRETETNYRTRAIITCGLYTIYPLFEVHLCTVTFGLMYG